MKPDVAAPGVDILAAFPPSETKPREGYYTFLSGTSMACPHVAGITALIKSVHPDWSPAAIRSALVTTGQSIKLNIKESLSVFFTYKTYQSICNPNKANNQTNIKSHHFVLSRHGTFIVFCVTLEAAILVI